MRAYLVKGILGSCFLLAAAGCGDKKDDGNSESSGEDATAATPGTEAPPTQPPAETPPEAAAPPPKADKVQLGDEAVGIKNNDQITAHYSLMTGLPFEAFEANTRDDILQLKTSLPLDNDAGKFNSSHVLATTKMATLYCDKLLANEQDARDNPASTKTARLPDLDWNSQKPLTKELARTLYPYFTSLFWGEDKTNLPSETDSNAALDELVDAMTATPAGQNGQRISLRGSVLGMCVSVAAAFSSIEL